MADIVASFHVDNACCCSGTPPAGCPCALLIPPFGSPYADYATAEAAIADQTVDCILYDGLNDIADFSTYTINTGTPDTVVIDIVLTAVDPRVVTDAISWLCLNMKAGSTLNVAYDITATGTATEPECGIAIVIYDCNGSIVDSYGFITAPDTATLTDNQNFSITADGIYYIKVGGAGRAEPDGTSGFTFTTTISSDDTMTVNPVIAQWDDGGTTRSLWACPKMLLPPLTESTGDWYVDCAAAAAVLTDALQVSNCVGYCGFVGFDPLVSFTATDGGSSLSFSIVTAGAEPGVFPIYGSVNAVAGETITVASSGGQYVVVSIYDDTGTLVETMSSAATSQTSSALPYTGRYIIDVALLDPGDFPTTWTATITSSGTMSVNPIQALYDTGLTCPARLDCGDTCP